MMDTRIKTIEDLSLNAWPSHQIQYYDGWLLRFSYFYTHRTNSVEVVGPSEIPFDEKIEYCEAQYRAWGTPAVFKITPLLPPSFDAYLAARGYLNEHETNVMLCPLGTPATEPSASGSVRTPDPGTLSRRTPSLSEIPGTGASLTCSPFISDQWIEGLFALKNTTNIMHRRVVPSMYHAIPKETLCVSLMQDGKVAGTGLGILDRSYVGVYAIHVHPSLRRMGCARAIVSRILEEGAGRGAHTAYLQVTSDNEAARSLYRSLGFKDFYTYRFRVR